MKNKPYTAFKSKNKIKNSQNFGFSHSLTFGGYAKLRPKGAIWAYGEPSPEPHTRLLNDPSAAWHGAKRSEFFVSENHPAAVVFSYILWGVLRKKCRSYNSHLLRVNSSAINSACFNTVSVASACISGG